LIANKIMIKIKFYIFQCTHEYAKQNKIKAK